MSEDNWVIRVSGPASFQLEAPASQEQIRGFLLALANSDEFRGQLQADPHGTLKQHNITVSPADVIPTNPQLPPKDKVLRALEDLDGIADPTRSKIKGVLFAVLGGP